MTFYRNKYGWQLSDAEKDDIPEHVKKAAREMNRKAFEERLKEIKMSEYDAKLYEQFHRAVQPQVTNTFMIWTWYFHLLPARLFTLVYKSVSQTSRHAFSQDVRTIKVPLSLFWLLHNVLHDVWNLLFVRVSQFKTHISRARI